MDIDRPGSEYIDIDSPVSLQYNLHGLPTFIVYGPNGREMFSGDAAEIQVLKTMQDDID